MFILGGFATTAHALSYTLFSLAAKPALQRTIEAELAAAGLLTPGVQAQRKVEHDDLRSLPYLANVVKESLRLFPVIAGVPRCPRTIPPAYTRFCLNAPLDIHNPLHGALRLTNRPMRLGPYMVPTRTMVYVLFYRMHNNRNLWHKPEEFLPERWAEQENPEKHSTTPAADAESTVAAGLGEDILARNEKKYLPFSEGPRGCLGQVALALIPDMLSPK